MSGHVVVHHPSRPTFVEGMEFKPCTSREYEIAWHELACSGPHKTAEEIRKTISDKIKDERLRTPLR